MPRANRYFTAGSYHHITDRCHDRSFLLRFARDRSRYREVLRLESRQAGVSLLGYAITSNHIHLVLASPDHQAVAQLMQRVQGQFAREYNRRKRRSGAYWGDRYHATLVDGKEHLFNCLRYIDLNMVRAGVVSHPDEWEWCGFHELIGRRRRYRLIDQPALLEALEWDADFNAWGRNYRAAIEERIQTGPLTREPEWTESLAVGSRAFISRIEMTLKNRRRVSLEPYPGGSADAWTLREGEDEPWGAGTRIHRTAPTDSPPAPRSSA